MAYADQSTKSKIKAALAPILEKYGVKGTLSVQNHMTVVLKIKNDTIGIVENYFENVHTRPHSNYSIISIDEWARGYDAIDFNVNHYYISDHYSGKVREFLTEVNSAMQSANWYNRSDISTDYFDVAYYYDIIAVWKR